MAAVGATERRTRANSGAILSGMRRATLNVLTSTRIANACRPLVRDAAVVFAMHRFARPEVGIAGFGLDTLRTLLAFLRRNRHDLVGLQAIVDRLRGDGRPLWGAVAFTIDDGYREQAEFAAPVFAEFDCPVTTFVTTGFLDQTMWFWWDQVEFIITRSQVRQLVVEFEDGLRRYQLDHPAGVASALADVTRYCKTAPEGDRDVALRGLAQAADVEVPTRAPIQYAAMTWDALRDAERRGMSFGPHTMTHPILARTDASRCQAEVEGSWARLRAEAQSPVAILAYPNGKLGDYGAREVRILKAAGLVGACTCTMTYATKRRMRESDGPFLIPRFAPPAGIPQLIQFVSGLERLKLFVRRDDGTA